MKLAYVCATSTNPYENIAMEEYLTFHTKQDGCILFLWQNENTVVIGKNQNAFRECKVSKLTEAGGRLARRLSGGGAVFHDLGNLNFTFCVRKEQYDVDRQLQVIVEALKEFGLTVEKSGRNDLQIDGKKFSGNAYYASGEYAYHHGTIMIDVNETSLMDYLTVSAAKLVAKGVDSVRSRVVNLNSLNRKITVERVKEAMLAAFCKVYGETAEPYVFSDTAKEEIKKRAEFFASEEWLVGNQKQLSIVFEHRFPWGEVSVQMETQGDRICDVNVYTDALDDTLAERIEQRLRGCRYQKDALLENGNLENNEERDVIVWISALL
ncbi:lipoate-protein ligase A [Lachnospiraceae bacterium XBB1006]|nr:lipoate-protein ligase A [Lachnospiraceae bacterium XBB1006]